MEIKENRKSLFYYIIPIIGSVIAILIQRNPYFMSVDVLFQIFLTFLLVGGISLTQRIIGRPKQAVTLKFLFGLISAVGLLVFLSGSQSVRTYIVTHIWIIVLISVSLILYITIGIIELRNQYEIKNLYTKVKVENFLAAFFPRPIASAMSSELMMIVYAFNWKARPDIPPGAIPIFYHGALRPTLWILFIVCLVDIAVLHVIVTAFWGHKIAWITFIASEIGVLYILGFISSLDKMPILLFTDRVEIRTGFLLKQIVQVSNIKSISQNFDAKSYGSSMLKASLATKPSLAIELHHPIRVLSIKKLKAVDINAIGISPDQIEIFIENLKALKLSEGFSFSI